MLLQIITAINTQFIIAIKSLIATTLAQHQSYYDWLDVSVHKKVIINSNILSAHVSSSMLIP